MVIRDISTSETSTFEELGLNDVFFWEKRLCIKTGSFDDEYNAYDLDRKILTTFGMDADVHYVPSELVLHGRGWKESE